MEIDLITRNGLVEQHLSNSNVDNGLVLVFREVTCNHTKRWTTLDWKKHSDVSRRLAFMIPEPKFHPLAWMTVSSTIKMTATASVYSRSCMLVTVDALLLTVVSVLLVFPLPTRMPDSVLCLTTPPSTPLSRGTTLVT